MGGAVEARIVNFEAQRQIAQRSTVRLFARCFLNSEFNPLLSTAAADSVVGGLAYSRSLSPHLSLQISLLRQGFVGNVSPVFGTVAHDVAALSFSYDLGRPIGR